MGQPRWAFPFPGFRKLHGFSFSLFCALFSASSPFFSYSFFLSIFILKFYEHCFSNSWFFKNHELFSNLLTFLICEQFFTPWTVCKFTNVSKICELFKSLQFLKKSNWQIYFKFVYFFNSRTFFKFMRIFLKFRAHIFWLVSVIQIRKLFLISQFV